MKFKQSISIGTSIVLLTSSLYSDTWSSTQNEHGFILKSNGVTIYLGKSCDATSPQYGTGEWYWKDNEVVVSLSKKDFSFDSSSLYEDGRCQKKNIVEEKDNANNNGELDDATKVGIALGIAAIAWLFGAGNDDTSSSSSSSSDYSSSSSYSSTYSSVNNTYTCTYTCRTDDVFLSSHTYKASLIVNASSQSSAKEVVISSVESKCNNMRDKYGDLMRVGSIDCE